MPDFERLIDSAFIHAAPSVASREWMRGYSAGKSEARREVAAVAAVIALLWVAGACLLA